jgi:peptidylprolyl isomerase
MLALALTASIAFASPAMAQGQTSLPKPEPVNTLVIELKSGPVHVQLLPNLAPNHVARVKQLAKDGYYNGVKFHRVIDGFMAQTGDHTGTGTGGSKYGSLRAEFTPYAYRRGTVGAARTQDPNSANSQFYICFTDTGCSSLTGQYTVWGQVISGMEHVDRIKRGAPGSGAVTDPDVMQRVYLLSDKK